MKQSGKIPVAIAHNKTSGVIRYLDSSSGLRALQREWLEVDPTADIDVYVPQNTPSLRPTDNMRARAKARGEDRYRRLKEQEAMRKIDDARRNIERLRGEMEKALSVIGEYPEHPVPQESACSANS